MLFWGGVGGERVVENGLCKHNFQLRDLGRASEFLVPEAEGILA